MTDFSIYSDRIVLACCIYGEARGEPVDGQIAVGCVVRNRVRRAGASSWKAIILAPLQFSCFNPDDPNFPILERAAVLLQTQQPMGILAQCEWIADGVISGAAQDVTHGAQNYLSAHLFATNPPAWAVNKTIVERIGGHVFLNA